MSIPASIKRQACEGLLHSYPKKSLARELNISCGTVRDWSIFVEHDFFDWVNKPYVGQRKHQLSLAAKYWFDHYPIGYSDVARLFGLRPAGLYAQIQKHIDKLPVKLRPARIRFWDVAPAESNGGFVMAFEKLSDIPSDRPLNLAERKALMRELEDARTRLICAESLLEVAVESCKDELKKKELMRQLEQTRKVLASFGSAK